MEGGTKIKANRSSIIRIIISNYDSNGIKEIKVRYNKQAQLDTFLIESKLENGVFTLRDVKWKAKEKNRYDMIIGELIDNTVKITKIDKFSNEAIRIREYIIKFSISPKNKNVVVVDIKDCMEHNLNTKGERSNTRRDTSQTERKLLSKETQISYSKIACCPPENIDSLKIYKIKRYLSYRSNMLLFFSLINDFICEGIEEEKIVELYKITSKVDENIIEERVTKIAQYLRENLSNELKNYNNGIEKTISKKSNSINDCNNRIESCKNKLKKLDKIKNKKEVGKLERIIKDSENKIKECNKIIAEKEKERLSALAEDKIKEDVYKILELYSDLRHKLAHYNYAYFENLFENNIEDSNMVNMAKLLDLNIFKYLELSKKLRIENKTNYLDDDTKFSILGVRGKSKKYYSLYNTLCEQKNGFNTFINNFFTKDGIEDIDFKNKVNTRFKEEIKELGEFETKQKKKKFKDKELELLKEQDTELETVYVWDIHNSIKYKELYKDRKNIVEKYNQILSGNRDKTALRDWGTKLLEIKNKMDNITKRNSIIRLKYKLQVAYAFLMKEFNGNIARFKSEFDVSKVEQIEKYQARREEYLYYVDKKKFKIEKFQEILGELEASNKVTWLSSDMENNLFKFYVLTYILLPFEFKGDFLGFVKKHYYDIKNVEYIDENNEELTNEQLEKMKDDSFFNKIRLFEKNSKKYNIFSKSYLTNERVKKYFEKLNIGVKHYEYVGTNGETKGIFNKNIIIPIFKYYQIIIKLYNDVEIAILLYLSKLKGDISIDEVIDKVTKKQSITKGKELDFYSLNGLFGFFELINDNLAEFDTTEKIPESYLESKATFIRNKVFHFDYKNFIDNLLEIDCENGSKFSVSTEMGKLRKFIQNNLEKLTGVNLDYNFLNDYYMKKEQFIFGQLKQTDYTITNKEEKEQVAKNKNLLGICNLALKGNDIEVVNKIFEKYEVLKKISDSPEIKNYDEIIPNGIKLNEIRYIKKELEKKTKNENYRLNIDRIKEEIGKCSSDLLGLYKQQIITLLKRKIIEKIQYKEEKILTILTYEIETKYKNIHIILLIRKNSSNNFSFLEGSPNKRQIKIGDKTTLILEIGTLDKDKNRKNGYNLYLSLNKNTKGKKAFKREIIDLRQHYLFTEEVKFKDLK